MSRQEVRVHRLSIKYQNKLILSDFSTVLRYNEVTAVTGPSGSGKTSFLKALMGLVPYQGTIQGWDKADQAAVFQEHRLFDHFTAGENVKLITHDVSEETILRCFRDFELEEVVDQKVSQLSGGMQRRVAIVRALVSPAHFLCLDEPFKELDKALHQRCLDRLGPWLEGRTVVWVTHDASETARYAQKRLHIQEAFE